MGSSLSYWQNIVCVSMVAILPLPVSAQDASGALLRSSGTDVLVNNNAVPTSVALFRYDLIETQKNGMGRIELTGSSADIAPETIVEYDGDELVLDHGTVSVNTSRGLRVRVGCLTVTPVHDAEWTHFDVADVNGKVTVSALKNDVYINEKSKNENPEREKPSARSDRTIVRESEQKSREEKCAGAYLNPSSAPAGRGAILNSIWAKGGGVVAIGALTCLGLCHGDDPISPIRP